MAATRSNMTSSLALVASSSRRCQISTLMDAPCSVDASLSMVRYGPCKRTATNGCQRINCTKGLQGRVWCRGANLTWPGWCHRIPAPGDRGINQDDQGACRTLALDYLSMFLIHPDHAVRGEDLMSKNCRRFSRPFPTAKRPCCATREMGKRRRQSGISVGTRPDGTPRVMESGALQDVLQNPIVWVP